MYTSRTTAHAHQIEALNRLRARPDTFALLMGTGTGKTKVVLDEWGERVSEIPNLLVVAPAGSYANWYLDRSPEEPSEATKHLDPALRKDMLLHHWNSGGGVGWKETTKAFLKERSRPRMFVVNVEALSSVDRMVTACQTFLTSAPTLVCVDESSRIKGHNTLRTKAVMKLGGLAASRRIATGLVTPQSPMDLWSQFAFLNPAILGCRTFAGFRSTYAITRKEHFPGARWPVEIIVGFRNLDQLAKRIEPYSYRVHKEDCLDLPEKVYTTRDVALSDEQSKAYRELKEFATTKLEAEAHVTATSVITQILRLHQLLCGHLVDEQGIVHELSEQRTSALLDVLAEHDGKAVIWVSYEHSLKKLYARLEKEYGPGCVAAFWGGNRSERLDDETRFKTDPNCRFMLATPGAGGMGNTWIVADLVIYFSNSYDLEQRVQSEDRTHRMGQSKSVTYVDLVARGTVDEKILQALRAKINLSAQITGANWKEWVV
jgi:Superfamily II DNA/RNA helicases, SNF2 family